MSWIPRVYNGPVFKFVQACFVGRSVYDSSRENKQVVPSVRIGNVIIEIVRRILFKS